MRNKKLLQATALLCSASLVALLIAFRSGVFDKKFVASIKNDNATLYLDTFPKINKHDTIELIQKQNNESLKIIPIPMQKMELDEIFNFIDFNKINDASADTFEIVIPDTMFLVNNSFLIKNDKFISKDSLEYYFQEFIKQKIKTDERYFSSSKSARVISPSDKILHLKNYTFRYNKLIEFYTAKKYKFYENDFIAKPPIKLEGFYIDQEKIMHSSKSAPILFRNDLNKDTNPKQIKTPRMFGSKSARVISVEDVKKDTINKKKDSISKLSLDSTIKKNNYERIRSSKSAVIFQRKDIVVPKKIEIPNFFRNH
jgi:hypothetical protein